MTDQFKKMDIVTLSDGAVIERINHEMSKVFDNIADVNTDPNATREITVKLKFKPSEDRHSATTSVSCSSKLCSMEQLVKRVYFGEDGNAYERLDPKPDGLFAVEEEIEAPKKKGLKVC